MEQKTEKGTPPKEEMERKTCWRTYFGALSKKGGVGFGRGRGEQCVPVVRRTHLLSLPGWSDGVMKWEKKHEEKVNEVCNMWRRLSSRGDMMMGTTRSRGDAGATLRDEIKLLWFSLSDVSSKKGCRLGGAVTGMLGCGMPLVSRCSPGFNPWEKTWKELT